MNARSHRSLSAPMRTMADHHGRKAVTETTTATQGRHHAHRPSRSESSADRGQRILLLVLLIAQLMVILDITAVNIAMPSLAEDLQLTGSTISWTISS